MITTTKTGLVMIKKLKNKISRATCSNYKLNKKILQLKRSWDEVESILNNAMNKKKK